MSRSRTSSPTYTATSTHSIGASASQTASATYTASATASATLSPSATKTCFYQDPLTSKPPQYTAYDPWALIGACVHIGLLSSRFYRCP